MRKLLLCSMVFMLLSLPTMASPQLDEANTKFTYQGKPIHPFLLEKFSNWLSDNKPPIITSADVAASFDTNEFENNIVKSLDNSWWFAERGKDVTDYASFSYKWLGKTANGTHVVEVGANGGGSGFFMGLMFFKFLEGEITAGDKAQKQILMTIVRTYVLGDRYEGEIKVYPDRVVIPKSKDQYGGGAIDHDVELRFSVRD